MHVLRLQGSTGPIVRDLLHIMAEMSTPRWPSNGPSIFQYIVDDNEVIVTVDSFPVYNTLYSRYTNNANAAEGRVSSVNGVKRG